MDESEVLATFVAITGADEAQALSLLEASNFNLEEAVNLHMAMNDGHQGSAGAGPASTGHAQHSPDEVSVRLHAARAAIDASSDASKAPICSMRSEERARCRKVCALARPCAGARAPPHQG